MRLLKRIQKYFQYEIPLRLPCIEHSWKHYLITTVEEFDDGCGGPASRRLKAIDRKCMRCGELKTEIIRND